MAIMSNAPRQMNWKLWGGAALVALIVLGAAGYWFDWYGTGTTEAIAPVAEQAAPVNE